MSDLPKNKTFCVRPFIQYSSFNGHFLRLCCSANESIPTISTEGKKISDVFNSEYMTQVRSKIFNGQAIPECGPCYRIEALGKSSDRIESNKNQGDKYEKEILTAAQNGFNVDGPKILDLRVGNVCNLKCQSCFPNLSVGVYDDVANLFSKRADLRSIRGDKRLLEPGFSDEQLKDSLASIELLKIIGGEPMLSQPAKKLLDYCVEQKFCSNIDLHLHTNLTQWNSSFLETILQFKSVRLGISLDGFGPVNEYLRYPSRWNAVEDNFKKLASLAKDKKNLHLVLTPVLQITNVYSLITLLQYLENEKFSDIDNFSSHPIILQTPSYYSIFNLPDHMLSAATENFVSFYSQLDTAKKEFYREYFEKFSDLKSFKSDHQLLKQYLEVTAIYDKARSHDIRYVFPQVEQIIKAVNES